MKGKPSNYEFEDYPIENYNSWVTHYIISTILTLEIKKGEKK